MSLTDIVTRLRLFSSKQMVVLDHLDQPYGLAKSLEHEAADEIERLRAERDRLRGLVEDWKIEPVGGISNFGVIYLSPERVAALVDPLKAERDRLRAALHRISLGSQNSGTTKEDLGREARTALGEGRA